MSEIHELFEITEVEVEIEEDELLDFTIGGIIIEQPKPKGPKSKIMHVSNAELLEELAKSRSKGDMTDRLGEMFIKLATHYLNKYEWRNYTYKDEMLSLCILYMCQCWNKFKPEITNQAFSYFTQVCYSACLRYLAYEKKASRVKDNLYNEANLIMQTNFVNHYTKSSGSSSDDVVYYEEEY